MFGLRFKVTFGESVYHALVAENAVEPETGRPTGPRRSADEAALRARQIVSEKTGVPVDDLVAEREG